MRAVPDMFGERPLVALSRLWGPSLLRFLVVGIASALLNTATIVALTELLGLDYLLSYGLCFALVNSVGFALNRRWSFRVNGRPQQREWMRYLLVAASVTASAMMISRLLVQLGVLYPVAVFFSAGMVAPINFVGHRRFSFKLRMQE